MNLPDSLQAAVDARRNILWEVVLRRGALEQIDLFSPGFEQSVRGFHLAEVLPGGVGGRWMACQSEMFLKVSAPAIRFVARSIVPENRLRFLVEGELIASFSIGDDWVTGEVDVSRFVGGCVKIRILADQRFSAPGDDRELAILFRHLSSVSFPTDPEAKQVAIVAEPATRSNWIRPDLTIAEMLPPKSLPLSELEENTPSRFAVLAVKYFQPRDAISHEVLAMASLLEEAGICPLITAEHTADEYRAHISSAEVVREKMANKDTLFILHHGTAWAHGARLFESAASSTKVLRYHNVTSSEAFLRHPSGYLDATVTGRHQTTELSRFATRLAAPSFWALGDLLSSGVEADRLYYLPFLHDLESLASLSPVDEIVEELKSDARIKLLLLGRQVPSKGLHHALRVLACHRARFGGGIRLDIVGSRDVLLSEYYRELEAFITTHRLGDCVIFHPEADRRAVASFLRGCDALLTMSESDAACIPVLEAGSFDKPTIGLNRGGKGEHAGPGQLLFDSLDDDVHVETWQAFASCADLRAALGSLAGEHVRTHFSPAIGRERFLRLIPGISNEGEPPPQAESGPGR